MESIMIKSVASFLLVFLTAGVAMAAEGGSGAGASHQSESAWELVSQFSVAQWVRAKLAAAALEGIARNPSASDKVFVPMILGLAFVESLVLFAGF